MAMAITANAAELTAKENAIVDIGAAVARGEQDKLGAAHQERRYRQHPGERQALARSRAELLVPAHSA